MSAESKEFFKHELYTYVENEKDADAVAWAWVNKEKVVKYPFKFPPLAPNEIRANVYTSAFAIQISSMSGIYGTM